MGEQSTWRRIATGIRRIARVLARPVRGDRRSGLTIQAYRGYGSQREFFVMGRVFQQPGSIALDRKSTFKRDLLDMGRRLLRWGVADVTLCARFAGLEQRVITDADGYFRLHLGLEAPPDPGATWHDVELEVVDPAEADARAVAEVYVPPERSRYVVVSDIDDTVMYTGVANRAKMLWRLFFKRAESRVAFAGVDALYQALHGGLTGDEDNVILYVSRGPWSIYEVLESFFRMHDIPVGPILFLREWGLSFQSPLPRRARDHKKSLIAHMLKLYHDRPFILIGDSGQRDPEIYAEIVAENPERVLAVYIRNVTHDRRRQEAIADLARELGGAGSMLLLASDSTAMATHAAEHGLIAPDAVARVRTQRRAQQRQEGAPAHPVPEGPVLRRAAADAADALSRSSGGERPPNIAVDDAGARRHAGRRTRAPGEH